ncbi:hypothetical protein LTR85_002433 [Meristemomyces frigidus]|nr:hypothetical protein LTR85_002433 [Meristemomyces frigidus]
MFSTRAGLISPLSRSTSPNLSTTYSTPAPAECDDEDLLMQDGPIVDPETVHLRDKLESLKLIQSSTLAECGDLHAELLILRVRRTDCDSLHRSLGVRYMQLPVVVREHKALSPKHIATCAAAFNDESGETVTSIVLDGIDTILGAAAVGLREGNLEFAFSNMQAAETLLVQVSRTLKRLEAGVEEHEKLRRK